jgi:small subunit ribosomal protein S4
MGDPKRPRKKYETPRFPWRGDRLESELRVFGGYGLRNKRELWRNYASLSKYRKTARSLLAAPSEQRLKLERDLLGGLYRLGVLDEGATIDDVLNLRVENFLDRRLQTLVHRLGFAISLWQARQLIVHGHISVGGRRVSSPSYMVRRGEEGKIGYSGQSPISNSKHVIRESIRGPTVKSELKPGPVKAGETD